MGKFSQRFLRSYLSFRTYSRGVSHQGVTGPFQGEDMNVGAIVDQTYNSWIWTPWTHWVERGKGIPNERDETRSDERWKVWGCKGWRTGECTILATMVVYYQETKREVGTSSIFRLELHQSLNYWMFVYYQEIKREVQRRPILRCEPWYQGTRGTSRV